MDKTAIPHDNSQIPWNDVRCQITVEGVHQKEKPRTAAETITTSKVSDYNKLLIYKQVLKPIGTYDIQLWGSASEINIHIIQRLQNKVLRIIMNCPWYVRNADLQRDIGIETDYACNGS